MTAQDQIVVLTQSDQIRSTLQELRHPDCQIVISGIDQRPWPVRILGPDAKDGYFFWRPLDLACPDPVILARMADEDEPPLAFHAQTADGARIHFCVDSPVTLRFGDGSIAVLSLFPSAVRHTCARPPQAPA
ncbi:hypothetical protein ACXXCT_04225 [Bordetella bronchiseptica]